MSPIMAAIITLAVAGILAFLYAQFGLSNNESDEVTANKKESKDD